MKNNYYACISIDVVNSEKYIGKLNNLYNDLTYITNDLNEKFKNTIKVPFSIRKGDEIVGVVSSFPTSMQIFTELRMKTWKLNIELYCGIGLGKIETYTNNLNEMNGSAVIKAFRAQKLLKENKKLGNTHSNTRLYFLGEDHIPYEMLNSYIDAMYNEVLHLSNKRKDFLKIIEMNPNNTLEQIGEKLGYENNRKENAKKLANRTNWEKHESMRSNLITFLIQLQNLLEGTHLD